MKISYSDMHPGFSLLPIWWQRFIVDVLRLRHADTDFNRQYYRLTLEGFIDGLQHAEAVKRAEANRMTTLVINAWCYASGMTDCLPEQAA